MTEISQHHASIITECFKKYTPRKIIETGTYQGLGSTKVIASLIRDLHIQDAKFYSIECNEAFLNQAKINIAAHGLMDFVTPIKGLSIPRALIPTEAQTEAKIQKALSTEGVVVDHNKEVAMGAVLYSKEAQTDGQEDLLGYIIKKGCFNPDFVLLDSAGHIGSIEFEYILTLLTYPCLIALDDARHIKHFESKVMMQNDSRFKILYESNEHTGSLIAQFTP